MKKQLLITMLLSMSVCSAWGMKEDPIDKKLIDKKLVENKDKPVKKLDKVKNKEPKDGHIDGIMRVDEYSFFSVSYDGTTTFWSLNKDEPVKNLELIRKLDKVNNTKIKRMAMLKGSLEVFRLIKAV